jgi:hypothetical protein
MRHSVWIGTLVVALAAVGQGLGAEPSCGESSPECCLKRWGPAGGWHPYGGGLLHWWPRDCFPCGGAPDDYCRKPLPTVCWPPYPPFYTWGPPEICYPHGHCPAANGDSH